MLTNHNQRWRERRALYVPAGTLIRPRDYTVDRIEPFVARRFVAEHHYLPGFPAAIFSAGLFRSSSLCGVAIFAVPCNPSVVTRHSGLGASEGCVLARFVLLDEVPGNGESWFLSRALGLLRSAKPHLEAVVSYADPSAGHIGRVYAAMSSAYRGETGERAVHRIGCITVAGRTLSKIRLSERGCEGAMRQLQAAGAPARQHSECPGAWLERLRRERVLVASARPGLHAYCFELSHAARRAGRSLPRLAYPKVLSLPQPELPFLM